MIVLVGESASGKSCIEKMMVEKYGFQKTVSYTTRQPRQGEIDGIDYHYISESQFIKLQKEGYFAEVGEYNGWYYGTAKNDCISDKVAVVTPHGLRQLAKIPNLDIHAFYINVPRRDRLIKILQRGDNIEEAYRRSLSDVGQFDGISDEVDYIISNENYTKSIDEMTKEVLTKLR